MKIDGIQIAQEILDNLKKQIEKLKQKNITPHLAIILVGNDSASVAYVKRKEIKAKELGIKTTILHLSDKIPQTSLLKTIQQSNNDKNVHGIIVQQPLPTHINLTSVINAIDPKKDVDGFHPDSHFQTPLATAVLKILEKVYINTPELESRFVDWLKTKRIVVIGKGQTGGKPIIHMLEKMKIPLTVIDSKTKSPENLTKKADIIISAVGKENILKPQMIKRGAALIDIGISKGKSAKLMGDYDQNRIENLASFYTPTPGGVGPVNVAMLLKNTVLAAEKG